MYCLHLLMTFPFEHDFDIFLVYDLDICTVHTYWWPWPFCMNLTFVCYIWPWPLCQSHTTYTDLCFFLYFSKMWHQTWREVIDRRPWRDLGCHPLEIKWVDPNFWYIKWNFTFHTNQNTDLGCHPLEMKWADPYVYYSKLKLMYYTTPKTHPNLWYLKWHAINSKTIFKRQLFTCCLIVLELNACCSRVSTCSILKLSTIWLINLVLGC